MARKHPGFYRTIEYIGPRPQKKKKRHFFGGWVILLLAIGVATWFGRPLVPFLKATQQGASLEQAALLIASLEQSNSPGAKLAASALAYSGTEVAFDPAYYRISYPNGDIAPERGGAADVVIRCLRQQGIDLQREVHDDMSAHFRLYPQLWGALAPDSSIDHRRVANLQRFFERKAQVLTPTRNPADFQPGDIVIWSLANAEKHLGIVVPGPGERAGEAWVVHHREGNVKWEDVLFDFKIDAHFRYPAPH